jgi:Bifunctional DNA primase/polymerase, N-terminal/Primase C terminal 1 (PriCT-1)
MIVPGNPHLETVLGYARLGWRVLPCHSALDGECSCARSANCRPGKHPRTEHGLKDASGDDRQIEVWATQWPGCNWAVATGPQSGVFVLDVDGERGRASLDGLESKYGPLPATRISTTGRGEHRWFGYPAGRSIRTSVGKIGRGLDVRGNGGYVLVPPSIHANGAPYKWRDANAPIADAPDWLMELLAEAARREQSLLPDHVSVLVEGKRNDGMFRFACALRRKGLTPERIASEVDAANLKRCKPPLRPEEIEGIVSKAARYPRGGPDPLETAWKAVSADVSPGYGQFLALAENLQRSRPALTIALPVERIGELMRRDWTQVRRWRKRAAKEGRLQLKESPLWLRHRAALYIFHRVPLAEPHGVPLAEENCPSSTKEPVPLSLKSPTGLMGHPNGRDTLMGQEGDGGLVEIVL